MSTLSNEAKTILDRVEALLKRDEQWIKDNIHAAISNLEHGVAGGQQQPAAAINTGLTDPNVSVSAQEPEVDAQAVPVQTAGTTLDPSSLVPDEHKE